MKKSRIAIGVLLMLVFLLTLTGVAFAQDEGGLDDGDGEEDPTEVGVTGLIVDVNLEEGTITLEDGTIIYISGGDYDHPIVELLGEYFSGAGIEDWAEALDALTTESGGKVGEVVEVVDESGNVVGWQAVLEDGTVVDIDEETAAQYLEALGMLNVDLTATLGEDGETLTTITDVGGEIAAYHDDGMGFGVLVKLYAIAGAAEGGVSVEELVAMFKDGAGMGHIFKEYGKPGLLGVGHVRKALKGDEHPGKALGHEKQKQDKDKDKDQDQDQDQDQDPGEKPKDKNKDKNKDKGKGQDKDKSKDKKK
jgi:hypothetical protein